MKQMVLILGRRTGTSTLAKAVFDRGLNLAGPLDVAPFDQNPQGHYECEDVRNLNIRILKTYRTNTNMPGLMAFRYLKELPGFVEDRLHHGWGKSQVIVKEPLLASTWPMWWRSFRDLFDGGVDMKVIWCRRDRADTIRSCERWFQPQVEELVDWGLCVDSYALHAKTALDFLGGIELWLDDPDRESKALDFIELEGLKYGEHDERR